MSADPAAHAQPENWQDEVYDLLRLNRVTQFAYDAGHKILIDRSLADPDVHSVALTTKRKASRFSPARTSAARVACCWCRAAASAIASTCFR